MEMCNPRNRNRTLQMLYRTIKLIKNYNNKMFYPMNEHTTIDRTSLIVHLAMQKNPLRNRPLTPFFAASNKHSEQFNRSFYCGF